MGGHCHTSNYILLTAPQYLLSYYLLARTGPRLRAWAESGFGFGFGLGFGLGAGFGIGFGFGVGFEVTLSDLAVAVSVPLLEELYRTLGALG